MELRPPQTNRITDQKPETDSEIVPLMKNIRPSLVIKPNGFGLIRISYKCASTSIQEACFRQSLKSFSVESARYPSSDWIFAFVPEETRSEAIIQSLQRAMAQFADGAL